MLGPGGLGCRMSKRGGKWRGEWEVGHSRDEPQMEQDSEVDGTGGIWHDDAQ